VRNWASQYPVSRQNGGCAETIARFGGHGNLKVLDNKNRNRPGDAQITVVREEGTLTLNQEVLFRPRAVLVGAP